MEFADLDLNKVYSYDDYYNWSFENREELIKGKVFRMIQSPGTAHQLLSGAILARLWEFLKGSTREIYAAPFDVRFPQSSRQDKDIFTVLQPDLSVFCDQSKLDDRGGLGAPDIVIEVLSPGNNAKELKNNEVYEEAGVKEYWIVSPQDNTFVEYTLTNGRYAPSRIMVASDVVYSSVLEGFGLDLAELFGQNF